MSIKTNPGGSTLWWKLFFLLIGAVTLGACNTNVTPTPAPVVVCPTTEPSVTVRYNEFWESSPHANEEAEAFRHWDADNPQEIPVDCAMCHSRTGFLDFLGVDETDVGVVNNPSKIGTVITCFVCHNEESYTTDNVVFPSGKRIGNLGSDAFCITCHQGRESTMAVNIAITNANLPDDDASSPDLLFLNSHSTSAATSFGNEVQGAYEYKGKSYKGRFIRGDEFFTCNRCHDQHSLKVKIETCSECHTFDGMELKNIRVNTMDLDGDGNVSEGIAFEIEQIQADLYKAIQTYAREDVKVPIVYDFTHYPYYFIDTNGNSLADPEEVVFNNQYNSWTPRLLRAAYNYNYAFHDAGAFAHNSTYIAQVLYDSLADFSGDTSGKVRP